MKPSKIINMMAFALMWLFIVYCIITTCINNQEIKLIVDSISSFIFPTFVFISFWYIGLKRNKKEISLPKFYLKVCLNIILPYFICLIPYMIYNSYTDLFESIISENGMLLFKYLKTMIELFVIYPLMEYWVKRTANFTIVTTLILSLVFGAFNISTYIHTEIFEYLIFAAIGIYFATYENKVHKLLRENKKKYSICIVEFIIIMFFTIIFKDYSWLYKPVITLYSLSILFGICYLCYRVKIHYQELRRLGRGYIYDFVLLKNPPIVLVSIALLLPLVGRIFYDCFAKIIIPAELLNYISLFIAIIIFSVSKISIDRYQNEHEKDLYCKKERW